MDLTLKVIFKDIIQIVIQYYLKELLLNFIVNKNKHLNVEVLLSFDKTSAFSYQNVKHSQSTMNIFKSNIPIN